jgi:hypothetical protein
MGIDFLTKIASSSPPPKEDAWDKQNGLRRKAARMGTPSSVYHSTTGVNLNSKQINSLGFWLRFDFNQLPPLDVVSLAQNKFEPENIEDQWAAADKLRIPSDPPHNSEDKVTHKTSPLLSQTIKQAALVLGRRANAKRLSGGYRSLSFDSCVFSDRAAEVIASGIAGIKVPFAFRLIGNYLSEPAYKDIDRAALKNPNLVLHVKTANRDLYYFREFLSWPDGMPPLDGGPDQPRRTIVRSFEGKVLPFTPRAKPDGSTKARLG